MSTLSQEVRNVQNPALGSTVLWRFACGYTESNATSSHPPVPLLFIVLPIVLHRETFELLKATQRLTGLHGFADKFSKADVGKSDVLLSIQPRASTFRRLTWESLQIGIRSQLLTISTSEGTIIPVSRTNPRGVPDSVRPILSNAEKLGTWCGELTLFEIGTILKVGF